MYRELSGNWAYQAGANGTAQIPASAIVLQVWAWASSGSPTVTINGGSAIPLPTTSAPIELRFLHDLVKARGASTGAEVVFSSDVKGYFVEYFSPGNGS